MYVVWGVAKHTAKCRYGISYHLTGILKWLFIIIPSEIFEDLEGSLQDPCIVRVFTKIFVRILARSLKCVYYFLKNLKEVFNVFSLVRDL